MAPKGGINVRVLSLDTELEFTVLEKTTGKLLFDQIIQTTGLRETWYFGLQFTDSKGGTTWLSLDKKLNKQDIKKEATLQFRFRFKYYPENVADEIIQDNTLRLLYLQIKSDILAESVYCPPEKAVLLASYATQVKHGDFDSELHSKEYLANDNLLPRSTVTEHKLSREEWEQKISIFHAKHKGMTKEEAMLEYLKVCQDLETYGISYFDITNSQKTELVLGVDALGINVYAKNNRLNPQINFPWSEINKISYEGNKFIVKVNDKEAKKFVANCPVAKQSKRIYDLASGNHEMYMRRRRPDTLEVQQMKSQKAEMMEAKVRERAILNREMAARARAEQQRHELEERVKEMEARAAKREKELEEAQENIKRLEDQLRELREAKERLEAEQDKLTEMLKQLEEDKGLEAAERARMEEEVRLREEEIQRIREEVEAKEAASRRLQEEVEEARVRIQESEDTLRRELEQSRTQQRNGRPSISGESSATSESGEREEYGNSIGNDVIDPVEAREVEMEDDMKATLAALEDSLAEHRIEETEEGKQYRENLARGQDKYKTLREVRKGNTKRRIDSFENL